MTVTKSIGTAGGRDYSTIAAFEAALPATLTDAYVGECYNDSEFTVTASIVFSGFTTTSTNTVTLTAAAGQSFVDNANAQTNALRYNASNGVGVRKTNGYGNVIDVQVDYVTLKRLQAAHSGGNGAQVYVNSTGGASPVARNTDQCLFQHDSSGNNPITKLRAGTHTNSVWIENNNSTAVGCQISYPIVVTLANLTLVASSDKSNTGTAFSNGTGSPSSLTLTNVAVFGFSGGFASSNDSSHGTANYCATDQSSIGLAGGTGNLTSKTYANQFQGTASTGLDFRLKSGADLIDAGTADTTDIPSAVDIVGTSRPQGAAWDIGAWEFVSSGTTISVDFGTQIAVGLSISGSAVAASESASTLVGDASAAPETGLAEARSFVAAVETSSQMNTDGSTLLDGSASLAATQTVPIDSRSSLIAERGVPIEWTGTASVTVFGDQSVPVEFAASVIGATRAEIDERGNILSQSPLQSDFGVGSGASQSGQIETGIVVRRDSRADTEASIGIKSDILIPTEWTGTAVITINGDAVAPLEFGSSASSLSVSLLDISQRIQRGEFIPQEILSAASSDLLALLEYGGSRPIPIEDAMFVTASIKTKTISAVLKIKIIPAVNRWRP